MAQQISREEWERKYGRGRLERPQPVNIPGLPAADEVLAELAYAQQLQDAQPPADPGRSVAYSQRFGPNQENTFVRLLRGRPSEGRQLERRQQEAALEQELMRQAVRDAQPAAPAERAAGAELAPPTADEVFSSALGRPVSPGIANRAKQYVEILGLNAGQAVKLAEREAAAPNPRAAGQALPANWVQAIAAAGELGPDPAAKGALRAAMEGVIDESTPIEAQMRGLDPYMQAAEAVALAPEQRFRELDPSGNAQVAAMLGAGRKLPGGRRNPFDKEVKTRLEDPYLVPVLLAEASEPLPRRLVDGRWQQPVDAQGQPLRQPPTITMGRDARGFAQRVYDAGAVQLGLLDPRAVLPPDLGYLRRVDQDKTVSGGYSNVNAPTLQQLGDELHGFAARDDLAAATESMPMTLGQAVQDIIYRNRTPLVELPHGDVLETADGRLLHRQSGVEVFPVEGRQSGGVNSATYRYGRNSEYDVRAFQEFGGLIEALTGQRVVVNEKLRDPGLWRVQRAALNRSLSDDWRSVRGATSPAELKAGKPADLPIEGTNPTYDVMRALARGGALPPAETTVSPLANQPREREFYQELLQPQLQQLRDDARTVAQQSTTRPYRGALNTANLSELNAPASPTPPATYAPEVVAQVPETVRPQIEAGLASDPSHPRHRAAQDFLARFLGRMRG